MSRVSASLCPRDDTTSNTPDTVPRMGGYPWRTPSPAWLRPVGVQRGTRAPGRSTHPPSWLTFVGWGSYCLHFTPKPQISSPRLLGKPPEDTDLLQRSEAARGDGGHSYARRSLRDRLRDPDQPLVTAHRAAFMLVCQVGSRPTGRAASSACRRPAEGAEHAARARRPRQGPVPMPHPLGRRDAGIGSGDPGSGSGSRSGGGDRVPDRPAPCGSMARPGGVPPPNGRLGRESRAGGR